MSKITFLAHLPLIRIAEEEIEFNGGSLWRLPFEIYNRLSLKAFEDHEKAYTDTAPVFYRVNADLDISLVKSAEEVPAGVYELKMPSNNWDRLSQLGLDFVLNFQRDQVERLRAALLLAAPACGIPSSFLSVTFVRLAEPGGFQLGDQFVNEIRVQGDADQEYLFLKEAAGLTLSPEVIQDAESCLKIVDGLGGQPDLLAAMRALQGATAPILSPMDQLVLTVRAIEALLLPGVTNGLGRTFVQRLSSLLAVDEAHQEVLRSTARLLYDARSANLHGNAPHSREEADAAADQAQAQQLLAAAIRQLAQQSNLVSVPDQRQALDDEHPEYRNANVALPITEPAGLRKTERMLRLYSRVVATVSSGSDMGWTDGTVSWSPLIGLEATTEAPLIRDHHSVAILYLSGEEMVSLEERDTRRDFIAQLLMVAQPTAVLTTGAFGQKPETTMVGLASLLRRRDLATAALRLAGFSEFYDPELLGVFVYQDSIRTRFPSVFRQTIEQQMREPAKEKFAQSDVETVSDLLRLLARYDSEAQHPQVDLVLRLFRRGFDHEFLPAIARASLLFSTLEAMLGRFREPQALEKLVAAVVRKRFPEAATWFENRGRKFRNSIAHGQWPVAEQDAQPIEQLILLLRALIPEFVQAWLNQSARASSSPLRAFIESTSVQDGV
jgi:hypothetical protein